MTRSLRCPRATSHVRRVAFLNLPLRSASFTLIVKRRLRVNTPERSFVVLGNPFPLLGCECALVRIDLVGQVG